MEDLKESKFSCLSWESNHRLTVKKNVSWESRKLGYGLKDTHLEKGPVEVSLNSVSYTQHNFF